MNVSDVLEIHNKLHDSQCEEINWGGTKFPIEFNGKKKVRYCTILVCIFRRHYLIDSKGHKFMTQNLVKESEWMEKAKNGWKVTWYFCNSFFALILGKRLVSTNPWGRIVTRAGSSTPYIGTNYIMAILIDFFRPTLFCFPSRPNFYCKFKKPDIFWNLYKYRAGS